MAIYLNGMDQAEQQALTEAMLNSGTILDFSDIPKPKADKHSTGGVGDKTSIIIAPLVAACGACVPMISGRGLGHTGGTLDKLESIPGYRVNLSASEFKQVLDHVGYAMAGQTAELAPADKRMYALRDATATVEAIPLIVASIISKKGAAGLDAMIIDVKVGNGAFMREEARARELAHALVSTGNSCGIKTRALLTDMNQPLGGAVGNSLEVEECINILRGEANEAARPVLELSMELSAHMLVLANVDQTIEEDRKSTRLNSSHGYISYAVFCLNKKTHVHPALHPASLDQNLVHPDYHRSHRIRHPPDQPRADHIGLDAGQEVGVPAPRHMYSLA